MAAESWSLGGLLMQWQVLGLILVPLVICYLVYRHVLHERQEARALQERLDREAKMKECI